MKKYLIILGGVLLVGFLVWLFLPMSNSPTPTNTLSGDPFGSGGDDINIPALNPSFTGEVKPLNGETNEERLFKVSGAPIAGYISLGGGASTSVRYVDRATGHIYEANLSTLLNKKLTNQTIPQVYEAYFRKDGNAVLIRTIDEDTEAVENLSLILTPSRATSTDGLYGVSAVNLRGDIESVMVDNNNLVYVLKGNTSIVSSTFSGSDLKTLLSFPFTNWRIEKAGSNILLYTKADSSAPGYAYLLNPSTRALQKILGPLNGLIALSNNSGRVLYSYLNGGEMESKVINGEGNVITDISPAPLAEKCVWSVRENYLVYCGANGSSLNSSEPQNWYKGISQFSDNIWRFDTNLESGELILEPKASFGIDLDVMNLSLSQDESYLLFINKGDLNLWALKIK